MRKIYVIPIALLSALIALASASPAWANAVNVTKVKRHAAPNRDLVSFELSWQNSWNVLGPPGNHDAVWVFIKFRPCSTNAQWSHALLQTTGVTAPFENGTNHTLHTDLTLATPIRTTDRLGNAGAHNTGAMIRRKNIGTGHIENLPCTLKVVGATSPATWSNAVEYDIRVVAIEMVQIKSGSYRLGDETSYQSFLSHDGACRKETIACYDNFSGNPVPCPCTNCYCYDNCYNYYYDPAAAVCASIPEPPPPPLVVSNETSSLTVYVKNDGGGWYFEAGPFNLSANYPKGVNEFYVMKYEITQGQYADFLNTINLMTTPGPFTCYDNFSGNPVPCPCTNCYCQENDWWVGQPVNPTTCQLITPINNRYYSGSVNRYGMTLTGGKYVPLETNRACNFLSYDDVASYLDWAALRPMTELEYEKACRGPLAAVAGEYVWGTAANLVEAINITSPENGAEVCTDLNANLHYQGSNWNVVVGAASSQGPIGAGIFARDTTQKRISTGAAYYGAMEMGGNVREMTIGIRGNCMPGNLSCYTGVWGDGVLDASQKFNTANWPTTIGSYYPFGYRGGSWGDHQDRCRISDRQHLEWGVYPEDRDQYRGGRGCR